MPESGEALLRRGTCDVCGKRRRLVEHRRGQWCSPCCVNEFNRLMAWAEWADRRLRSIGDDRDRWTEQLGDARLSIKALIEQNTNAFAEVDRLNELLKQAGVPDA